MSCLFVNLSDPRLLVKAQGSFVALKKDVGKTLVQACEVDSSKKLELRRVSDAINGAINEIEAATNFQELPHGQILTVASFNTALTNWGVTLDAAYSELQGLKAYISARAKKRST